MVFIHHYLTTNSTLCLYFLGEGNYLDVAEFSKKEVIGIFVFLFLVENNVYD